MSGMGGYGQKCEKMPKSLHLNTQSGTLLRSHLQVFGFSWGGLLPLL
jgi:hypothetical protein